MCLGSQKESQNHKGTLLPPLLATAPIFSCEWPASSMRLKRVSHQHLAFLQSQYLMPGAWYLKLSQFSARLKIGQISDPVQRVLFPQLWHVLLWPPEAPLSPQSPRQPHKPTTLQPRPGSPERPWHGNINIRIYRKNIESSRISTQLKVHSLDG